MKCVRDKTGYFAERLYTSMKVNIYVSKGVGGGGQGRTWGEGSAIGREKCFVDCNTKSILSVIFP